MSERSKVSNELLTIAAEDEALNPVQIASLWRIADRIDAEMVELPKDRDGTPIRVGDTVFLSDGRKGEVSRITFGRKKTSIDLWMCDKGSFFFSVAQRDMTHAVPDSWERIADELDEMAGAARHADDACERLADLAERIRKLAAKEEDK